MALMASRHARHFVDRQHPCKAAINQWLCRLAVALRDSELARCDTGASTGPAAASTGTDAFCLVLDSGALTSSRALLASGIAASPAHIIIPNPSADVCAQIRTALPSVSVFERTSHELLDDLLSAPQSEARTRLGALDWRQHFSFVYLDYCGNLSSRSGKKRLQDVSTLFEHFNGGCAESGCPPRRWLLAVTLSERGTEGVMTHATQGVDDFVHHVNVQARRFGCIAHFAGVVRYHVSSWMNTVCFVIENPRASVAEFDIAESSACDADRSLWRSASVEAAVGAVIVGTAAGQLACRVRFSSAWPALDADFMVAHPASPTDDETISDEKECNMRSRISKPVLLAPPGTAIRPLGLAQNRIAACFADFVGIAAASAACPSFTAIVADNKQVVASQAVARAFEGAACSASGNNALRVFTVLAHADECVRADEVFASRVCSGDHSFSFKVSHGKLSSMLRSVRDASAVANVSRDLIGGNSPVAGVMVDYTDLTVAKSSVTMRTAARWRDIVAVFECISSDPVSSDSHGLGLRFADQWVFGIQYNMAGSDTGLPWVDADIDWLRGGVVANAQPHGWTVDVASAHTFVSGHVKRSVNFIMRRASSAFDQVSTRSPLDAPSAQVAFTDASAPDTSTWPPAPVHPEWREWFAWDAHRGKVATREAAKFQWAAAHFCAALRDFGRDHANSLYSDRPRVALSEPGFMCALPALFESDELKAMDILGAQSAAGVTAIVCMTVDDDVQRADLDRRLRAADCAATHADFRVTCVDSLEVNVCDTRGAAGATFWFLCCAGGDAMFREHWWTPLTAWFQRILRDANVSKRCDTVSSSLSVDSHLGKHEALSREEDGACAGGILSFMIATPDGPVVNALIADICALAMQQSVLASPANGTSPRPYLSLTEEFKSPLELSSSSAEVVPSFSSSTLPTPFQLPKRPVHSRKWAERSCISGGQDLESVPRVGKRASFMCACIHQTLVTLRVSISHAQREESFKDGV
jgi:hypothetical protein